MPDHYLMRFAVSGEVTFSMRERSGSNEAKRLINR